MKLPHRRQFLHLAAGAAEAKAERSRLRAAMLALRDLCDSI